MNVQLTYIFPEYSIAVQIYEVNDEILNVKHFLKYTNCMFINVNLDKNYFDSFVEIIKIKILFLMLLKINYLTMMN